MKKNLLFYITIVLICISFLLSTGISISMLISTIGEENESNAELLAEDMYNQLNNELQKHVNVGLTIANNHELFELLINEDSYTNSEKEILMKQILKPYVSNMNYETAFVVSNKSGQYYTQNGFNKVVSPEKDAHDVWYSNFLQSNKTYAFDIDTDETNEKALTAFINVRMLDADGNIMGVCGVGRQLGNIQKMIYDLQDKYSVFVQVVDKNGFIQMDVNDENIDQESLIDVVLDSSSESTHYIKTKDGYVISKYIENLEWFIVIRKHIDYTKMILSVVCRNLLIMGIVFVCFLFGSTIILQKGSKKMAESVRLNSYGSLSSVYAGMYLIRPSSDTIKQVKNVFGDEIIIFDENQKYSKQLPSVGDAFISDESRFEIHTFMDMSTIEERMEQTDSLALEFLSKPLGWCRGHLIAERSATGKIQEIIFAIEVIDQEKKAQEAMVLETKAALAASDAKGKFLANMSHEIRTPINAVLGMDAMIIRESREPKIREYAQDISRAGQTLLSIINDILDFSKIESGKMQIVPMEYELASLIYDVMNIIMSKAEAKKLAINLNVSDDLPSVLYGDDVRLRQILMNILNNAVKYTPSGSVTLTVEGEQEAEDLLLYVSVQDTGIGIKPEDMKKLFSDFERIEEQRNRNIEGTGLGMSITMQLLKLMDSKLEVESTYGEGSKFYFTLRQKIVSGEKIGNFAERMKHRMEDTSSTVSFIAPKAKVLVVDDNQTNREVFKNLLKESQVQIEEAAGGKETLVKIAQTAYDIIFLDHMMPDMDGIAVMKNIKHSTDHLNVDTPVIALTANAVSGAKEMYLEAGFNSYISKPIMPEKLDKILEEYIPMKKKTAVEKKERPADLLAGVNLQVDDLPQVEGVDWNFAALHFPTKDALIRTIQIFLSSAKEQADELARLFDRIEKDEKDVEAMDLFRIKVHAMKSNANLLGILPLAGCAMLLEWAARAKERNKILAITPHYLSAYREISDQISLEFAPTDREEKKEIEDMSDIADHLHMLDDAMQNFDIHGADEALEYICGFQYTDTIKELLEKLSGAVKQLNMEEVSELTAQMLKALQ